jgi:hypothetical protein
MEALHMVLTAQAFLPLVTQKATVPTVMNNMQVSGVTNRLRIPVMLQVLINIVFFH